MPLSAAAWLLLAALAPAPSNSEANEGPSSDAGSSPALETTQLTMLASEGLDGPALELELSMRVPELALVSPAAPPPDAPFVYIEARHESGRLHRVALIFSDGRAYYERVDVGEAGSPERVLASSIAALLASISAGAVEPDALGVRTPVQAAEPEPDIRTPPPDDPVEQTTPAEQAAPGLQLGLHLGLHQLTALAAPAFADRHLGWYGGAGLELRTARGLFAALELRPGGARTGEHRLTRIPIATQLGYAWRGAHLELVVAGAFSLAPWLVTTAGQAAPVTQIDGGRVGRPPLLSFGLRVSPGYLVQLPRGRPVAALRVGPRLGLGGGFVLSSPPRVAGLESQAGVALFRLGGVELDAGLELVTWFSPRVNARARR